MMTYFKSLAAIVAIILAAAGGVYTLTALPPLAAVSEAQLTLDAARAQGLVGERPDGLVGSVSSAPGVDALVNQVNTQRLAAYRDIATREGTPLNQVQAVAGAQLIQRLPSGQFFMTQDGAWAQK